MPALVDLVYMKAKELFWHSKRFGPVRWAVELLRCKDQPILLQPTAVNPSAVVLLMRKNTCEAFHH